MPLQFIATLLISFLITLVLTPVVKKMAFRFGAIDKPNERKVHESIVPRWGGIAIFIGIWTSLFLAYFYSPVFRNSLHLDSHLRELTGIFFASLLMLLVGILDDLKPMKARVKLLFQIAAAFFLIVQGVKVTFITNPSSHHLLYLGRYAGGLLSVIWIIGITNALNLLDGLDGLLVGISTISAATLFIAAIGKGYFFPAFILTALGGASIAFLRYNFNPAQIFLGDSGSLFIGILWASLSIAGALKTSTITFFVPLLILGIPIADTLFAIGRRFKKKQSIFEPDKDHLHHRLLKIGLSQRKAVLILYGISLLCGALALLANRFF